MNHVNDRFSFRNWFYKATPVVNDTIFSVNEFPQDKTQIGKISAYDPENESLSYSIISGNNQNIFSIDYEGNIVVENGSLLDYEIKNSYLGAGIIQKNFELLGEIKYTDS